MVVKNVKKWECVWSELEALESEYDDLLLSHEEKEDRLAEAEQWKIDAEELAQAIELLRGVLPVLKELEIPPARMDALRAIRSIEVFLEDRPSGVA